MEAILDTSIIIEVSKGNEKIIKKLKEYEGWKFYLTSISNFELKVGILSEKERALLSAMPKLSFDEKASDIASELFKTLKTEGKLPPLRDLFIASIALANNLPLITCDKDFLVFSKKGLKIILMEK